MTWLNFGGLGSYPVQIQDMQRTRRQIIKDGARYIITINACTWEIMDASMDLDALFELSSNYIFDAKTQESSPADPPKKLTLTVKYGLCPIFFILESNLLGKPQQTTTNNLFDGYKWSLKQKF